MKLLFVQIMWISSILFTNTVNAKDNSHKVYNNHISTFMGTTYNTHHKAGDFTLGLDYEFRPSAFGSSLGFGMFGEFVWADHSEYLLGFPLYYHFDNGAKVLVAPGVVFSEKEYEKLNINTYERVKELRNNTEFLIRFGLGYDFHINRASLSPTLSLDYIDSHLSVICGISCGIAF